MASWEDYLQNQINADDVQATWNGPPNLRSDNPKLVVAHAIKEKAEDASQQPPLEYDPVLCQKFNCKSVLNPMCVIDFRAKLWQCCLCDQRNPIPSQYAA